MKSPYNLDRLLGMEYFITSTQGIGGKLRTIPEDFYVEEIFNFEESHGEYTHFILEKKNWDTLRAIKAVAKALGVSHKRFGYAGVKDKRAVTRQRIAAWKIEPEQLEKIKIKDIKLSDFKKSSNRISLGDALGNKFKIVIRNVHSYGNSEETLEQLKKSSIPNYFGYQRFGIARPNTHIVGRELVKGNIEAAVMAYLAAPFETEKQDEYEARKFLQETKDYKKALKVYPRRLNYERSMLDALAKKPNDYAGALRRLPKKLRLMLVHAYQGYLFNKVLSRLIENGDNINRKIPVFGYDSSPEGEIEKSVLEEEGVEPENFKISSLPELSSKGVYRDGGISTEIKFQAAEDELNAGKRKCVLEFFLPKGSYATAVLREFMKAEPPNY